MNNSKCLRIKNYKKIIETMTYLNNSIKTSDFDETQFRTKFNELKNYLDPININHEELTKCFVNQFNFDNKKIDYNKFKNIKSNGNVKIEYLTYLIKFITKTLQ